MPNIRDLRGRIKSVLGIKQITRAMEMVATTKLRRFQDRAVQSRPYTMEIQHLVTLLAACLRDESGDDRSDLDLELLQEKGEERIACLVITSDRGLCGAYNSNVYALLETFQAAHSGAEIAYYAVGRKGVDYIHKRGYDLAGVFDDPPLEKMTFLDTTEVTHTLVEGFRAERYQQVHVLYTAFESMMKYVPSHIKFLPIDPAELTAGDEGGAAESEDILLEPDPKTIFDLLVPRYLEIKMYNALLESLTSEYASRRISMKNATEAADEMAGELRRIYNRARQERITKELLEIVSGAEALK